MSVSGNSSKKSEKSRRKMQIKLKIPRKRKTRSPRLDLQELAVGETFCFRGSYAMRKRQHVPIYQVLKETPNAPAHRVVTDLRTGKTFEYPEDKPVYRVTMDTTKATVE